MRRFPHGRQEFESCQNDAQSQAGRQAGKRREKDEANSQHPTSQINFRVLLLFCFDKINIECTMKIIKFNYLSWNVVALQLIKPVSTAAIHNAVARALHNERYCRAQHELPAKRVLFWSRKLCQKLNTNEDTFKSYSYQVLFLVQSLAWKMNTYYCILRTNISCCVMFGLLITMMCLLLMLTFIVKSGCDLAVFFSFGH